MGLAAEIHIKFIGAVSTLFACGLIIASSIFLARILGNYDNFQSHPGSTGDSLEPGISSEEALSMYRDRAIPESRPMKHFSDGVEKKQVDLPRSPEQIKTDNSRIESKLPGITDELNSKKAIKLDDLLHFTKSLKTVTSIRPPDTRKNRIMTARVSTVPKRVSSLKPLLAKDAHSSITSDNLRHAFPNIEMKWESEKITVDSILQIDALDKKPVVKRDVHYVNPQFLRNRKILTNCPSSSEYNVFIVLSSIGIVCGILQVIAASLVCCATNKIAPGISTLLILYNVSSCIVLIVIFGLTLAYGSCTRRNAERSEWLAFASLVGLDASMLFALICYGTYILANDTQLNVKQNINSDEANFEEDEDQVCFDAQRV